MSRAGHEDVPDGWAGELVHLFKRLKMTSGADPVTGKRPSVRQIAKRAGYVPSHVWKVINGVGRPSPDAVVAVAEALNASDEDLRPAAFYAEQLERSPARRAATASTVEDPPDRSSTAGVAADVLVGRDAEIKRLHNWLHEVVAGRGRSVLIEGEPGIGKSSLMRAIASDAAVAGCQVFWASCDELSQAFPLLPLLDTLDVRPSADNGDYPSIAETLRSNAVPGNQADLVTVATERLLRLVRELCAAAPTMIVVDDLQWADQATVTMLGRLSRAAPRLPLLMVTATRPVPRRDDVKALRRMVEPADRLPLRGLTDADVVELITRAAAGVPDATLLRLAAGAGGNPLYLTELVDALIRSSGMNVDNGAVAVTGAGAPRSLSGAIADRLRFLSSTAHEVVRTAALLGADFSVSDLSVVSGRRVGELMPVLDEAILAGVLLERGAELTFRHPLIRDALYEGMPAAVRAAWHRDAARVLAEAGAPASRVGRQLLPAMDGQTSADEWTVRWLTNAGQQLVGQAPHAAIPLLRWALAGTSADADPHDVLTCRLADALYRVGDADAAAQVATGALAHVTHPDLLVDLHWTLAQCRSMKGRSEESLAVLESALRSPNIGRQHRARLLVLTARVHRSLGHLDAASEVAEEALAAATAGHDRWATAWSLTTLALVHAMRGESADALAQIDKALAVAEGDPTLNDLRLVLRINQAVALGDLNRYHDAVLVAQQARKLAEDAGNVVRLAQAQSVLCELFFEVGRWDDALVEAAHTTGPSSDPMVECCTRGVVATIHLHRDGAASQQLAEAERYAERLTGHTIAPLALARSIAWERVNAPAEALAMLTRELSTEETEGSLKLLADTARLAVLLGDSRTTDTVVSQAEAVARTLDLPHRRAILEHCRGLSDNDPGLLLTAADQYEKAGRPLPRAQALEAAGMALAANGDTADATVALSSAVTVYSELGADWDLARARATLHAHG